MRSSGFFSLSVLGALTLAAAVQNAHAAVIVSEIDPAGSGTAAYGADWYELTNTGPTAVDITGWKMDDNSFGFATAVPLRDVTSIASGQSVVFMENGTDPSTDATLFGKFETAWFGASVPNGFVIGAYGGSGVGLSTSGDGVEIFDSAGNEVTKVTFGAAPAGATFDNAAGLSDVTISTASLVGANGAFTSSTSSEIGSPGAVPEPASLGLLALGGLALLARRRR